METELDFPLMWSRRRLLLLRACQSCDMKYDTLTVSELAPRKKKKKSSWCGETRVCVNVNMERIGAMSWRQLKLICDAISMLARQHTFLSISFERFFFLQHTNKSEFEVVRFQCSTTLCRDIPGHH